MAEWVDRTLATLREIVDAIPWQALTDNPAWKTLAKGIASPAGLFLIGTIVGVFAIGIVLGLALRRPRQTTRPDPAPESTAEAVTVPPTPRTALRNILKEQGVSEPIVAARLRDFDSILGTMRESLKTLSAKDPETAPLIEAADQALDKGDFSEAIVHLDQACGRLTAGSRFLANAAGNRRLAAVQTAAIAGDLEMTQRHYGAASRHFARAIDTLPAKAEQQLASLLTKQATAAFRAEDRRNAAALFERAVQTTAVANGRNHPSVAKALNRQATARLALGEEETAEKLYRRALTIHRKALGEDHLEVATDLNNLAQLMRKKGNTVAAEPLFRRVLNIRRKALGADHPAVRTAIQNHAEALRAAKRPGEGNPSLAHAARTRR